MPAQWSVNRPAAVVVEVNGLRFDPGGGLKSGAAMAWTVTPLERNACRECERKHKTCHDDPA